MRGWFLPEVPPKLQLPNPVCLATPVIHHLGGVRAIRTAICERSLFRLWIKYFEMPTFLFLLSCSPTCFFFDGSFCVHVITNSPNSDYEYYFFLECGFRLVPLFWRSLLSPLSVFLADVGQIHWGRVWWSLYFGMRFFMMLQGISEILASLWNYSVPYLRRE
jgi:hypothetical protein